MDVFRAFLALPVPNEQHVLFANVQRQCASFTIAWTPPQNLHLTLIFLGDISLYTANRIGALMQQLEWEDSITLNCQFVAPFPSHGSPLLAAWIEPTESLVHLRHLFAEQLREHDIVYDHKSFKPHITLGRSKKNNNLPRINLNTTITPKNLALIQSEITNEGSIYTPLASRELNS